MMEGMQITPRKVKAAIMSAMWFSIVDMLMNSNECADTHPEIESKGEQGEAEED